MNILHFYPQHAWHDPVYIAGHISELHKLQRALEIAINHGTDTMETMASDGEGYDVQILLLEEDQELATPYIAEHASDLREGVLRPEELLETR